MRQLDLLDSFVLAVDELTEARRHALAAAVDRQHGGIADRRREEGAGLVRQMVFDVVPGEAVPAFRCAKALGPMMGRTIDELRACIDDIADEQRIPRRFVGMVRALQARFERHDGPELADQVEASPEIQTICLSQFT